MAKNTTNAATATAIASAQAKAGKGKGNATMKSSKANASSKVNASVKAAARKGNAMEKNLDAIAKELLTQILAQVDVDALVKAKLAESNAPVAEAKEKAPAKKASAKVDVKDFEPKKGTDGFYNYASWKAQRRKYVEAKTGLVLHGKDGQWLAGDEFTKAAAPFVKAFKYVKIADR